MNPLANSANRVKRFVSTLALISACAIPGQANAWTLIPGLPNPVTWLMHFIGGVFIEHYAQKEAQGENAGVAVSGPLGIAKEFTDLHFDPIDAIMWPLGAFAYRLISQTPSQETLLLRQNSPLEDAEIPWYMQAYFPHITAEAAIEARIARIANSGIDSNTGNYLADDRMPWYMNPGFPNISAESQATR